MARVIRLPDKGRLLVCTDLQGCMRDYHRMVEIFEQALIDYHGDVCLIFTGDLIHGPHIEPEDWPDFLGEYYRDASGEVMIAYAGLAAQYPGRVHALLGNHEHGHIGGPHTAKFPPDEVALLEHILGWAGARKCRDRTRLVGGSTGLRSDPSVLISTGRHEGHRWSPALPPDSHHVCVWGGPRDVLHARRLRHRHLLELPSVLHGQAEADGHRRPHRPLQQEVRQEDRDAVFVVPVHA